MSDTATSTETPAATGRPKRWYIVHAYSNFENKVAESIRDQAKQSVLAYLVDEFQVPKEKFPESRRVRKVET
jgi:transcriptional antiterminator NusG